MDLYIAHLPLLCFTVSWTEDLDAGPGEVMISKWVKPAGSGVGLGRGLDTASA